MTEKWYNEESLWEEGIKNLYKSKLDNKQRYQ